MAIYEYSSTLEEIEVTPGQAFTYEEWAIRSSKRFTPVATKINEHFMIVQKGPHTFVPEYRAESIGWQFFYDENWTVVDFSTYEQAEAFITDFAAFLGWMGGIAAPTIEEETYEDMLAAQYNERLLNQVVYYTENADRSERVARLIKVCRDGVLLADPADKNDQGCWYSFSEVSNIQRGRQYGWK